MAKALVGYVGVMDPRRARETRRLRQRIIDLEGEVRRLKEQNDALRAACRRATLESIEDLADLETGEQLLQPAAR